MADLTKARKGLDLLLDRYPDEMIVKYDVQISDKREPGYFDYGGPPFVPSADGPWVCVDLSNGLRFAIWKETGNVYSVNDDGSVEDEVIYEVTKETNG